LARARLKCVTHPPDEGKPHQQFDEVPSGGSYISQNDLRIHFGLGKAEKVDLLETSPADMWMRRRTSANHLVDVKEGEGIVCTVQFDHAKARPLK
jgi:enediyne biosynthesis protein E4